MNTWTDLLWGAGLAIGGAIAGAVGAAKWIKGKPPAAPDAWEAAAAKAKKERDAK